MAMLQELTYLPKHRPGKPMGVLPPAPSSFAFGAGWGRGRADNATDVAEPMGFTRVGSIPAPPAFACFSSVGAVGWWINLPRQARFMAILRREERHAPEGVCSLHDAKMHGADIDGHAL